MGTVALDKLIINGTAFWAHIQKPNELSGKFQIDVGNLDAATVKSLQAIGARVHNKGDDRNDYVTAKSSFIPNIVDAKRNPLPAGTLIGNGSKVNVLLAPYAYDFKGKKGVGLGLNGIQVLQLVSFKKEEADGSGFKDEDGFVSDEVLLDDDIAFGD